MKQIHAHPSPIEIDLPESTRESTHDTFEIQPINVDNQRDMNLVVEMLARYHRELDPAHGVYDSEYLRTQLEDLDSDERLLSFAISHLGEFVAHIGLRFDGASVQPEIILPAVDPRWRESCLTLSHIVWQKLEELAEKQRWDSIYQFSPSGDPALQLLSTRHFDTAEMAIIPELPLTERASPRYVGRAWVLLLHRFHRTHSQPILLYPPERHRGEIASLIGQLNASRVLVDGFPAKRDPASPPKELPLCRSLSELLEVSVAPQGDEDLDGALMAIEEVAARSDAQNSRFVVRVALDQPGCAALCDALEDREYRFCGIFPQAESKRSTLGHDWILYSRFDPQLLSRVSFSTPRARELAKYIINYR